MSLASGGCGDGALFCKDTPIFSLQCQPSGFSLGYEPRFGWVWGRGICPLSLARTYYIILGALLRYNRVSSPVKVYSPRQISPARRSRRDVFLFHGGGCYVPIVDRAQTTIGMHPDQLFVCTPYHYSIECG